MTKPSLIKKIEAMLQDLDSDTLYAFYYVLKRITERRRCYGLKGSNS